MKLRRILNYAKALIQYVCWQRRLFAFGWQSLLDHCDLVNPRAIEIGKMVRIFKGGRLEAVGNWDGKNPKITIGDGTSIQAHFHCGAVESVTIGKDVLIGGRVFITDHDHEYNNRREPWSRWRELICKPVLIEDGAWLCEGCVILKGVTVGRRAVVGANAVVTKDVPPFAIVGGVPASIIGSVEE